MVSSLKILLIFLPFNKRSMIKISFFPSSFSASDKIASFAFNSEYRVIAILWASEGKYIMYDILFDKINF